MKILFICLLIFNINKMNSQVIDTISIKNYNCRITLYGPVNKTDSVKSETSESLRGKKTMDSLFKLNKLEDFFYYFIQRNENAIIIPKCAYQFSNLDSANLTFFINAMQKDLYKNKSCPALYKDHLSESSIKVLKTVRVNIDSFILDFLNKFYFQPVYKKNYSKSEVIAHLKK